MFISVKSFYRITAVALAMAALYAVVLLARKQYSRADFGTAFYSKAARAESRLRPLQAGFELAAQFSRVRPAFMKAMVFPELMRYEEWKDDVETESLRVLYVQFGKEYADFSVGPFQMKPSFAEQVEEKTRLLLPANIYNELQLGYQSNDAQIIRQERIDRLRDADWQLVYLSGLVALCNEIYKNRYFSSELEKLQWYATVYNAGLQRSDEYIQEKIYQEQFYFTQGMPGKKFRYAALATYAYEHMH
jgi:hypothetical protein